MDTFALILSLAGIVPLTGRRLYVVDHVPEVAPAIAGPSWTNYGEEPDWFGPNRPFCID